MDVAGIDEDQISCPGCEVVFIDAEAGRAGAQVDQLDLLVPVGQEADVGIGTLPYHKVRPVVPDFDESFMGTPFCGKKVAEGSVVFVTIQYSEKGQKFVYIRTEICVHFFLQTVV